MSTNLISVLSVLLASLGLVASIRTVKIGNGWTSTSKIVSMITAVILVLSICIVGLSSSVAIYIKGSLCYF